MWLTIKVLHRLSIILTFWEDLQWNNSMGKGTGNNSVKWSERERLHSMTRQNTGRWIVTGLFWLVASAKLSVDVETQVLIFYQAPTTSPPEAVLQITRIGPKPPVSKCGQFPFLKKTNQYNWSVPLYYFDKLLTNVKFKMVCSLWWSSVNVSTNVFFCSLKIGIPPDDSNMYS